MIYREKVNMEGPIDVEFADTRLHGKVEGYKFVDTPYFQPLWGSCTRNNFFALAVRVVNPESAHISIGNSGEMDISSTFLMGAMAKWYRTFPPYQPDNEIPRSVRKDAGFRHMRRLLKDMDYVRLIDILDPDGNISERSDAHAILEARERNLNTAQIGTAVLRCREIEALLDYLDDLYQGYSALRRASRSSRRFSGNN